MSESALPDFVRDHVNLADARLGAVALGASDEFFAPRSRLLDAAPPRFHPGRYDEHGKWMDGWETRRRRGPGHDWCIVRLARPGRLVGLELDTSHFTGNFPPAASVDACLLESGEPGPGTAWQPLLQTVELHGDRRHFHRVVADRVVSHLRLNIFPDGGVARLRAYGAPTLTGAVVDAAGRVELSAALNGGRVIAANNEHFGPAGVLLLPGRGSDMGDGWETRRRREPGHDWCLIELARPGVIEHIEVDTAHFRGNYPDRCSLQAARVDKSASAALVAQSMFWPELLPPQALEAHHIHGFADDLIRDLGVVSHVRFNMIPDGGVSRLRLWGRAVLAP